MHRQLINHQDQRNWIMSQLSILFCEKQRTQSSEDLRSVHTRRQVAANKSRWPDHSMCTGLATSCSNTLRRYVAATNHFVCIGEFLWNSLSPQQNFVAATRRKKSNQTEVVRLVEATKFCCSDKDFHKKFSSTTKRFVAATCRRDMLLQLVAYSNLKVGTH